MPTLFTDTIICPDCGWLQDAQVQFRPRDPHPTYIHECDPCGYIITESEWQSVKTTLMAQVTKTHRSNRFFLVTVLRHIHRTIVQLERG